MWIRILENLLAHNWMRRWRILFSEIQQVVLVLHNISIRLCIYNPIIFVQKLKFYIYNLWLYILDNTDALFKYGSQNVDFTSNIEGLCSPGFERRTLDPINKCKDKYKLNDNGTLVFDYPNPRRHQTAYATNEFCFVVNVNATSKYEHLPEICVDVRREQSMHT